MRTPSARVVFRASSKRLSRRALLRGAGGIALALPWLEAMEARRAQAADAAPPRRLAVLYFPNGTAGDANGTALYPQGTGADYVMAGPWSPLEPHRADLTIFKNVRNNPAILCPFPNHPPAASCFLTGVPINKSYDVLRAGPSMDVLLAAEIAGSTRFSSLALGSGGPLSITDEGYSTAYYQNISWVSDTQPATRVDHPSFLFDLLFGAKDQSLDASRKEQRRSVLDFVQAEATRLKGKLGAQDKLKLDDYLASVRQLEQIVNRPAGEATCAHGEAPLRALSFEAQIQATLDLVALAFRCDLTRVVTYMMDTARSNRTFAGLGSHHQISHHGNDPDTIKKLLAINQFYARQLAYFLDALGATTEADGTRLLDHGAVLFGSGLSDANQHRKDHLPLVLAGHAGGALHPGQVAELPPDTPLANVHLTVMRSLGSQRTSFGDSTGVLTI